MASRLILARISRSGAGALHRLISARPEPSLFSTETASSFPMKVSFQSSHRLGHTALLNGTFQRLGFSSTASPQPNQSLENENGTKDSSDDSTKTEASPDESQDTDLDQDVELSKEELVKLVVEKEELLKKKQKEIEKMQDKVLRSYAEMENVIDRTKREADNSKKYAIQSFAKGLLDVADNLERASNVVKESFSKLDVSATEADGVVPLLKTLLEGVEMTDKQLSEVFRKFGVEKFDAMNENFDPHRHNAVYQIPDPSKPAGTVAAVLKNGYMLHERVLRPAEVGVTKSPDEDLN